jgi:hypothetical protein
MVVEKPKITQPAKKFAYSYGFQAYYCFVPHLNLCLNWARVVFGPPQICNSGTAVQPPFVRPLPVHRTSPSLDKT